MVRVWCKTSQEVRERSLEVWHTCGTKAPWSMVTLQGGIKTVLAARRSRPGLTIKDQPHDPCPRDAVRDHQRATGDATPSQDCWLTVPDHKPTKNSVEPQRSSDLVRPCWKVDHVMPRFVVHHVQARLRSECANGCSKMPANVGQGWHAHVHASAHTDTVSQTHKYEHTATLASTHTHPPTHACALYHTSKPRGHSNSHHLTTHTDGEMAHPMGVNEAQPCTAMMRVTSFSRQRSRFECPKGFKGNERRESR
jgi:hypothetical protein